MAPRLTFNFSSGLKPLFGQLSLFGILANRAVSLHLLDSISLIKKMALLAMSPLRVYGAGAERIFKSILLRGSKSQVFGVDAIASPTNVVNDCSIGYIAVRQIIDKSVRLSLFLGKIKDTITICIFISLPNMATGGLGHIFEEPFGSRFVRRVHLVNNIQNSI